RGMRRRAIGRKSSMHTTRGDATAWAPFMRGSSFKPQNRRYYHRGNWNTRIQSRKEEVKYLSACRYAASHTSKDRSRSEETTTARRPESAAGHNRIRFCDSSDELRNRAGWSRWKMDRGF